LGIKHNACHFTLSLFSSKHIGQSPLGPFTSTVLQKNLGVQLFYAMNAFPQPGNSVKALKDTKSTDPTVQKHQLALHFLHPSLDGTCITSTLFTSDLILQTKSIKG